MTTEKEQLEAEIAERDARIAEQLREITQLRRELGIVQEVANSALKAQQPSACVIGGTGISSSMRGALAEAGQQPASGGAYSSDPLACSGCAAGCFRCRSSAGVVVGALVSALEGIVHDERVPNEVSQDYAALLIEARRLNHCRAQAVPEGYVMVPVEPTKEMLDAKHEDGDGYLVSDDEYYFSNRGEVRKFLAYVWNGMLAAAPSANSEQARSCVTCNGVGIIGHSTLCPECATAPSTQQKESGDE